MAKNVLVNICFICIFVSGKESKKLIYNGEWERNHVYDL